MGLEEELNILIKSTFDKSGLKQATKSVKNIGKDFGGATKSLDSFNEVLAPGKAITQQINQFDDMTSAGMKHAKMLGDLGISYIKDSGKVVRGMKSMGQGVKKWRGIFQMEFLGLLFGGMAIQRLFQRMAVTAKESFMRITEGQGEAAQAFTALSASIELVRFTLGNAIGTALIPFIPRIIEIAEALSDWIGDNQELTAAIVIGGLALGTFMMTMGQFLLLGGSLVTILIKIASAVLGMAPEEILAAIARGFSSNIGIILKWIGKLGIWLAIFLAAWQTNLGGIRDTVKIVFKNIINVFGSAFKLIMDAVKDLWDIVIAIFEGDSDKLLEAMKKFGFNLLTNFTNLGRDLFVLFANVWIGAINLMIGASSTIIKLLTNFLVKPALKVLQLLDMGWTVIWEGLKNTVVFIWNGIISAVEVGVNSVLSLINFFIRGFLKLPKKLRDKIGLGDITEIDKIDFSAAKGELKSFKDILTDVAIESQNRYKQATAGIDNFVNVIGDMRIPLLSVESSIEDLQNVTIGLTETTNNLADAALVSAEANNIEAESITNKKEEMIDLNRVTEEVLTNQERLIAIGITAGFDTFDKAKTFTAPLGG